MFEDALWLFLAVGFCTFLIASISAPVGLLTWWAGEHALDRVASTRSGPGPATPPTRFIVYLGGIDVMDGRMHSVRERRFIDELVHRNPDWIVVDTVFPYAASGESLLQSPRLFGWLWRALAPAPERARRPLRAYLINFRNMFQVLIAADRRYGPIFSSALKRIVVDALKARGWNADEPSHIVIIGYSGGAQMAVSIAGQFDAEPVSVEIISIGGTIVDAKGVEHVTNLAYLTGRGDILPRVAAACSAGRWPLVFGSAWARAERGGRITRRDLGKMSHLGDRGYLGDAVQGKASLPNWEITLGAVCDFVSPARGGEL